MLRPITNLLFAVSLLALKPSYALTFAIDNTNIIGSMQYAYARGDESLSEIGRKFDLGVYEMIEANPTLNPWAPGNKTKVIVPTRFILPPGPKKGMVINLAEMRIYLYHKDGKYVSTYPIGIGKKGWLTPLGKTKITQKTKNPSWRPPKSIKLDHLSRGNVLPDVVPPGPDNPLGNYALRLSMPGYLIHGTNRPGGIGVRSSSGCIRLYPEDIQALFYQVKVGTKVRIIHEPYKFGMYKNQIYLEAHEPLSDPYYQQEDDVTTLAKSFENSLNIPFDFTKITDWDKAEDAILQSRGYPRYFEFFN